MNRVSTGQCLGCSGKGAPRALLTDHDGVKGHLLCVLPIVVESQMPDSGVQVLDEAGLVEADGPRLPPGSFGLQKVPLLPRDQPAAIQQLHEVVLGWGQAERVRGHKYYGRDGFPLLIKLCLSTISEKTFWVTGVSVWH